MKHVKTLGPEVRELFRFTVLQYMLDCFSENPKLCRILVDDASQPNTCFVLFQHLVFVGGVFQPDIMRFLAEKILIPAAREQLQDYFILCPDETWEGAVKEAFPSRCFLYERSLYRRMTSGESKTAVGETMSENATETTNRFIDGTIVEITSKLMTSTTFNLQMIVDEVLSTGTYDSMDDYLERGIGYAPVIDHKVCGFCTSEYPSKNAVAIGIEVLEDYRKQGYAKAMTNTIVAKASERGLTVYWECWKNNIASINTALSCEFEKVADYPVLYVRH